MVKVKNKVWSNIKEFEYNSLTCYIVKVLSPLLDDYLTTGGEADY